MEEYVSRFFAAHELQSTALDPDYGLFTAYQMPADKYEGLNACLCLLTKNMNNFTELNIRSTNHMNQDRTQSTMRVHPASCFRYQRLALPVQNSVFRTLCVMLKRLQMG